MQPIRKIVFLLLTLVACREPSASSSEAKADSPAAETPSRKPDSAADDRPDVLLITIDTLRPDALGWIGGKNQTPVIDRLAAEGFRLPATVSPVPLTLPAHATILSGLHPLRHGVHDNNQRVGSSTELLSEMLQSSGYSTAAFLSGYPLQSAFGLDQGFDQYDDRTTRGDGAWLERSAAETVEAAVEWLAGAPPAVADKPLFLWVHFYDPHYPYEADGSARATRAAYDAEVRTVDREIGRLLKVAKRSGGRELLTVLTADHGESLGEHSEGTHGFFIYDSTILVPTVFHWPGRIAPGELADAGRLADLLPTIADLLELPVVGRLDGVSLAPTLAGRPQPPAAAFPETQQPLRSYGWAPLRAIRLDGWKLIVAPRSELYDLRSDPQETTNLIRQEAPKARQLLDRLEKFEQSGSGEAETVSDPETLARLQSLGYIGAASAPVAGNRDLLDGRQRADPKDRIGIREQLTAANDLLQQSRYPEALAELERVLASEPENLFALTRSSEALLRLGRNEPAIERLQKAIAQSPDQPEIRTLLAQALTAERQLSRAQEEWMEVVRLQPENARAWSNLGSTLGLAGDLAGSTEALGRAAELEPSSPTRHAKLAFAAFAAGQLDRAVDALKTAATLSPSGGFPHNGALGLILLRQGATQEAAPWLAAAVPAEPEFAEAKLELAVLMARSGDPSAAKQALQEALNARPELARRAQQRPELQGLF